MSERIWPVDEEALRLCIERMGYVAGCERAARNIAAKARELQAEEAKRPLPPSGGTCATPKSSAAEGENSSDPHVAFASIAAGSEGTESARSAATVSNQPALTLPDGRPAWPFRLEDALRGEAVARRCMGGIGRYTGEVPQCAGNTHRFDFFPGVYHYNDEGKHCGNKDCDLFMLTPPKPSTHDAGDGDKAKREQEHREMCEGLRRAIAFQEQQAAERRNPPRPCSNCGGMIQAGEKAFCSLACAEPKTPLREASASVEQMCRELLERVFADNVCDDEIPQIMDKCQRGDLSGMAALLQKYMAPEPAKKRTV